ncbi:RagB/SusD family nutrient uptake outer membrane protein [Filimonas lacunae]|nr:RagB/SusD family nutrient uptake outer membrane protein [Filimonas lacunae]
MKYVKNIYILFAFTTLTLTYSCSKQLDRTPTETVYSDEALTNSNAVKKALVGAYTDLGSTYFYGGGAFLYPDLLGATTEINWSGTFGGMTQMVNKDLPTNNSYVANTWLAAYKAINSVNNVLANLDKITDADANASVEGQAKFIRGSAYFDLVRIYAKAWNDGNPDENWGVPLVLTPTTLITDSSKVARNTVFEVYMQVISDLTDAKNLLPATNGFYAGSLTASAMLARVYLQQGDYASAVEEADRVIASGKYSLTSSYADAFPFPNETASAVANTTEDVFAMQVTTSSGVNNFNTFYSPLSRGDIQIEDAHLNLYEANDDRLNMFYSSGGSVYTGKFDNMYGNVHIIRLAEMYLIRAEGNFREGTTIGAAPVTDINTIRNRVNLESYDEADVTLDKILSERYLELAFEGFKLHDIKRLEGNVGLLPWNANALVFPIPSREIKVNTKLIQNDGYN